MSIIDQLISSLAIAFGATLAFSLLLVCTKRWHGRYSLDLTHGVQKFHITPTPRIGGSAILAGLWLALAVLPDVHQQLLLPVLVASLPAFAFGLVEDLTRNVSVRARLLATMASGALCWALTDVSLRHSGFGPLDDMLAWLPFSVLFTAFAVGGVANAVNIIDGFNGLASGAILISMGALGLIALGAGDTALAQLCFIICAATGGFFLVNFPFGKLFLGDGGAYLLGFLLAWMAVLLVERNPTVSAWAPFLACGYPVFETLFTILRRLWCRHHPGLPDSRHLHSLIKKKVAAHYFRAWPAPLRNAAVSPFVWVVALVPAALAVQFAETPLPLGAAAIGSFVLYAASYTWVASHGRIGRQIRNDAPIVAEQFEIEPVSRRAAG
jgi:UDP-N-acetylmuramyl pentapeptide phosphotransferase/UDP-N-acetylglucosamine-1-phosphate transferase